MSKDGVFRNNSKFKFKTKTEKKEPALMAVHKIIRKQCVKITVLEEAAKRFRRDNRCVAEL